MRLIDADELKESMKSKKIIISPEVIRIISTVGMIEYVVGKTKQLMMDAVSLAPTVVASGEWEVVHGVMTPGGDPLLRCPICRSEESYHMGGIEMPQHWNFCPNCGADMRGEMNEK